MTDVMKAREEAICKAAKVKNIGEVSDGFHTFDGLYEQRMILFAALVKAYKEKAWKSYRHKDGEYCFGGGWFIVGIDTPEGSYTYHYENQYWNMFDCIELPRAKRWDGHTEADAKTRLMSLNPERIRGYLTSYEYAKKNGVKEGTVRKWLCAGRIEGIRLGHSWFVKENARRPDNIARMKFDEKIEYYRRQRKNE